LWGKIRAIILAVESESVMKVKTKPALKSPLLWLLILTAGVGLLTAIGPSERTLGANVRVVYLHGAWVWTSLAIFLAAGIAGLAGLLSGRARLHAWSRALGWTGLLFWITYLPISMWAMQSNWNGLYLAEPRWRLALIFAVAGLLLQAGLALIDRPAWNSAANLAFVAVLLAALAGTREVMHPSSPILSSNSRLIQAYFAGLVLLTTLLAWQVTRLLGRFSVSH
jgi:hypothetical protein